MLRCVRSSNDHVVERTPLCQPLSVVILYFASFLSHHSLIVFILRANLGVQVAHPQQYVPTVGALEGRLHLLIEVFFVYVIAVIGRCVALYDGHIDLPVDLSGMGDPTRTSIGHHIKVAI